ncbi:MAG: hypothetical protein WCO52_03840 [bacterium]
MNHGFAIQHCRIVAPERLSDRFLASGVFFQQESDSGLDDQVMLAYVLEISKPWFPSSKVLPSLLETLHTQHIALSSKRDLGDQFELLLRSINQQLNAISEQGETDWIGNLNGLIMVASGDEIHFSQTGQSPAYLLQKNRIRQITDDTGHEREPHPLKTFANLASGNLKADDYILVSNRELYNEVSLDALRRVMNNNTPTAACQSIVKELKRDKNLAVSTIILKVASKAEASHKHAAEIHEIILEDEMQSSFRKAQKRIMPWVQVGKRHSATIGRAGLKAAKTTGTVMKEKVAPKAADLLNKGADHAVQLKGQIAERRQHRREAPEEELPVVEIILPKAQREAAAEASVARFEAPRLIPDEELALSSSHKLKRAPGVPLPTRILSFSRNWLRSPQHKRLAALTVAVLLVAFTVLTAISRRQPSASTTPDNQISKQLAQAADLQKKAANAQKLNQLVEASKEIKQGEDIINGLTGLTADQKKEADATWKLLSDVGDSLSTTTRLAGTATTYKFTTASQNLVASLPFFYGSSSTVNGLLQTGQGDAKTIQQTISLPESDDSIVSIASSSESDTAGYALTKKDKVYRIAQSGSTTSLHVIAPTSGSFAPGDDIASYNGNVYILDGTTGLLWKYTNGGTTYSKGVSIIDTTKYDIKKSVSVAIDGSIYILKQDGSLMKFTSGAEDTSFKIKSLPTLSATLTQPVQVITSVDMDEIYVLDAGVSSGNHSTVRILVFDKTGLFLRQYAFPDSMLQVQAFAVDASAKKIWLLSGSTISEFPF